MGDFPLDRLFLRLLTLDDRECERPLRYAAGKSSL